jgi:hypothetical protein
MRPPVKAFWQETKLKHNIQFKIWRKLGKLMLRLLEKEGEKISRDVGETVRDVGETVGTTTEDIARTAEHKTREEGGELEEKAE